MRAIVLLLLGGGLLWLVLWNFSSSQAAEGSDGAVKAGYFLPAEPASGPGMAASVEPSVSPIPAADPEPDKVVPSAEPPAPLALPAAAAPTVTASPTAIDVSTAEEIVLASDVLHRPKNVGSILAQGGTSFSEPRRKLALAFAAVVSGEDTVVRNLVLGLVQDPLAGTAAERALLKRACEPAGDRAIVASVSRETPLMIAATMGLLARRAHATLEAGRSREAVEVFSELLVSELRAPWKAEPAMLRQWSEALARAQAGHHWSRRGGWASIEVTVEKGDSLISIRKRVLRDHPDLLLCTGQIERSNQLGGTAIQPGQVLRILTERAHVLVDIDARWLLYFLGESVAGSWEVGVGKQGSETQPGTYTVGDKNTEPMWFPPGRAPIPYGDRENPLGTRWMGWIGADGRNSGLAFHGTREPGSIGLDQSQGCVRMLNSDVEELYEVLPKGAAIVVQP